MEKIKPKSKLRMKKISVAEVYLWGNLIGRVRWDDKLSLGAFEYDSEFVKNAPVELAPLMMPKKENGLNVYTFPALDKDTFKGLPGMLADVLPDKYGSALLDTWLETKGRTPSSFSPVERLCYIGERGIGALEFKPSINSKSKITKKSLEISEMVKLASEVLNREQRTKVILRINENETTKEALSNLIEIGTSAGGARAKCIIAFNEKTGEVRSGQIPNGSDFSYWILKLDGVSNNRDKELNDPLGYGRREYAYYIMALKCGIEMSECRLLEENGRAHFMTKRFDRLEGGDKLHMQSLCAMTHQDFNMNGAHSYESVMTVIRKIVKTNPHLALEQQFRRAVFNVIGRNQDDHTKNIAFLMDKAGEWKLSPAYDMVYSFDPNGEWTSRHQMSINGKTENITREDLMALAEKADIKPIQAKKIIGEVVRVFKNIEDELNEAGVFQSHVLEIVRNIVLYGDER